MTSRSQGSPDNLLVLHFILQLIEGIGSPSPLLYQYMQGFIHPGAIMKLFSTWRPMSIFLPMKLDMWSYSATHHARHHPSQQLYCGELLPRLCYSSCCCYPGRCRYPHCRRHPPQPWRLILPISWILSSLCGCNCREPAIQPATATRAPPCIPPHASQLMLITLLLILPRTPPHPAPRPPPHPPTHPPPNTPLHSS